MSPTRRYTANRLVREPNPNPGLAIEEVSQHGARPELDVVDHEHTARAQVARHVEPVDHRSGEGVVAVDDDQVQLGVELEVGEHILGFRDHRREAVDGDVVVLAVGADALSLAAVG